MKAVGATSCRSVPLYYVQADELSPRILVWEYNETSDIWSSKYSNPATLPAATGNDASFNCDNTIVAIATSSSPYVRAYPWANGFGTAFSNPASIPGAATTKIEFTKDQREQVCFLGSTTSPYLFAYPISSSGWGTRYANPPAGLAAGPGTTGLTGGNIDVDYNNLGMTITRNGQTSKFLSWSYASGFGTPTQNNANTDSLCGHISFNGTDYFQGHSGGSSTTAYFRGFPYTSGGTIGTQYTQPSSRPRQVDVSGITTSQDGKLVMLATQTSGTQDNFSIFMYEFTPGSGWGTFWANPSIDSYYGSVIYSNRPSISPKKTITAVNAFSSALSAFYKLNATSWGSDTGDPPSFQSDPRGGRWSSR